uniref:Uncharacterized protein n=1 Tax=viral metagenome TaxID=1070528 RepID=A0A6M3JZS6_9ZZZZ
MKFRIGFVSNSSSASFILDKKYLTEEDINKIKNFCEKECDDGWIVSEDVNFLNCTTTMDNGHLFFWIKDNLNIPLKALVDYSGD